MAGKFDLVIFDVDGTLLDTTEGVLSAVKYTIRQKGYEMPDDSVLASFIGPPIQDSFANTYGLSGPILQELAGIFRNRYSTEDLLKAVPYEGIYETMQEIADRGIRQAVATYKREDYARRLLKAFHFDRYTDIMYGADHENKLKKKDIIEKCITDCGITDRKRVVMIGDTMHDALGAANVGAEFIGVTFGFGFRTEKDLEGVSHVGCADCPRDLLKFL